VDLNTVEAQNHRQRAVISLHAAAIKFCVASSATCTNLVIAISHRTSVIINCLIFVQIPHLRVAVLDSMAMFEKAPLFPMFNVQIKC